MPQLPKRSGTRMGHTSTAEKNGEHITKAPGQKPTVPHGNPEWDKMAKNWYDALRTSGQAQFYQQSDWAMAWIVADEISVYKRATDAFGNMKRSPMMLASILSAMSLLLTSEGDRRKVHMELQGPEVEEVDPGQTALAKYNALLAKPAKAS